MGDTLLMEYRALLFEDSVLSTLCLVEDRPFLVEDISFFVEDRPFL